MQNLPVAETKHLKGPAVSRDEVGQALSLLQSPKTRPLAVERLKSLTKDTEQFIEALWQHSKQRTRVFSQSLDFIKRKMATAPPNTSISETASLILERLDGVEQSISSRIRAEKAFLALSSGRECANPAVLRAKVREAVDSGKPLEIVALWEPAEAAAEQQGKRDPLILFMQMLARAGCKFNARFILNDMGAASPEASQKSYERLRQFIESKHNESFSLEKASEMTQDMLLYDAALRGYTGLTSFLQGAGALKLQGEEPVLVTNISLRADAVPIAVPALFLQSRAASISETRRKIAGCARLIQNPRSRKNGINAILNLALSDQGHFQEAWASTRDSAVRRNRLELVRGAARSFLDGSRARATADKLIEVLTAAEKAAAEVDARRICAALAKRNFRSAWPANLEEMRARVRAAVEAGNPITLAIRWGGYKETRGGRADAFDMKALRRIQEWAGSIGYPVRLLIVFCDMHATILNGKSVKATQLYRADLEDVLRTSIVRTDRPAFEITNLSALYKSWRSNPANAQTVQQVQEKAKEFAAGTDLKPLRIMAKKHSDLVRSKKKTIDEVVARYSEMQYTDDVVFDAMLPGSISVILGGSLARKTYASKRPAVFIASSARGFADVPWYLDANAAVAVEGKPIYDRNVLDAEKRLRAVYLDYAAAQPGASRIMTDVRTQEAITMLEQAGMPMAASWSVAFLYVLGDLAYVKAVQDVFKVLEAERPEDLATAMQLADAAMVRIFEAAVDGAPLFITADVLSAALEAPLKPGDNKSIASLLDSEVVNPLRRAVRARLAQKLQDSVPLPDYEAMEVEMLTEATYLSFERCLSTAAQRKVLAELLIMYGKDFLPTFSALYGTERKPEVAQ